MASDNDGELASVPSSAVVRPSPVPTNRGSAAVAESKTMLAKGMLAKGILAKGILVHCNNKRSSANTHRVSFDVSGRLTTPTPAPSSTPAAFRDGNDGNRSRRRQPDDGRRTPPPPPPPPQQLPPPVLPSASYCPSPPPPPPTYSAQDCRRTSGFGVKSYLHEFYDDPAEDHFQSFQVRYTRETSTYSRS